MKITLTRQETIDILAKALREGGYIPKGYELTHISAYATVLKLREVQKP